MPSPQVVSVRGANGINLYVASTEPGDVADLVSCQNIDLGVRRAVLPRLGLGRPSAWKGLVCCNSGDIFANEMDAAQLSGSILSMCAAGGLFSDSPSVTA
jgi:hypothetical protein